MPTTTLLLRAATLLPACGELRALRTTHHVVEAADVWLERHVRARLARGARRALLPRHRPWRRREEERARGGGGAGRRGRPAVAECHELGVRALAGGAAQPRGSRHRRRRRSASASTSASATASASASASAGVVLLEPAAAAVALLAAGQRQQAEVELLRAPARLARLRRLAARRCRGGGGGGRLRPKVGAAAADGAAARHASAAQLLHHIAQRHGLAFLAPEGQDRRRRRNATCIEVGDDARAQRAQRGADARQQTQPASEHGISRDWVPLFAP